MSLVLLLAFALMAKHVTGGRRSDIGDMVAGVYSYGTVSSAQTRIHTQKVNDENWLFLPSGTDPEAVTLYWDLSEDARISLGQAVEGRKGEPLSSGTLLNLTQDAQILNAKDFVSGASGNEKVYRLNFHLTSGDGTDEADAGLNIYISAEIPSMYLISDDPVNQGRAYVDATPEHTNRASGHVWVLNDESKVISHDKLSQIRVRGNTTSVEDKKPYKLTLKKADDLMQSGDKVKQYALLANYFDHTFIRNKMTLDLAKECGIEGAAASEWVDLYYDGTYCGNYLVCAVPQIAAQSADIDSLQDRNNALKANVDRVAEIEANEEYAPAQAEDTYGGNYSYTEGMVNPNSIDSGYLVEMDAAYYESAPSHFLTAGGVPYSVKSPKYCSREEMEYIVDLYEGMNNAAEHAGINQVNGKKLPDYLDLESFAKYISLQIACANPDGSYSSVFSTKGADDKVKFGPVWDFDIAWGKGVDPLSQGPGDSIEGFTYLHAYMDQPEIWDGIKEFSLKEIYPRMDAFLDGSQKGTYFQSFEAYQSRVEASRMGNAILWGVDDLDEQDAYLQNWCRIRTEYLEREIPLKHGTEEECSSFGLMLEFPILDSTIGRPGVDPVAPYDCVTCQEARVLVKEKGQDELREIEEGEIFRHDTNYVYEVTLSPGYGAKFSDEVEIKTMLTDGREYGKVLSLTRNEDGTITMDIQIGYI